MRLEGLSSKKLESTEDNGEKADEGFKTGWESVAQFPIDQTMIGLSPEEIAAHRRVREGIEAARRRAEEQQKSASSEQIRDVDQRWIAENETKEFSLGTYRSPVQSVEEDMRREEAEQFRKELLDLFQKKPEPHDRYENEDRDNSLGNS